jgi:hypothetical protein
MTYYHQVGIPGNHPSNIKITDMGNYRGYKKFNHQAAGRAKRRRKERKD